MPLPNEHSARIKSPKGYIRIRRQNNKFGAGIDVIFGVKPDGKTEVQSIRFDKKKFTSESARKWLKDHDYSPIEFEAAKKDSADTMTVFRVDKAQYRVGKVKKTDEGYITGIAPIAKVGILSYLLSDGTIRRELVNEHVLFNNDSMSSLKMKPITDSHPPERHVNSRNARIRKVGFTGETVERRDDFLTTSLTVTDDEAIQNIDEGKQELSPGYQCELELTSGTYNGEHYDAIQMKRTYNHLAICDSARAGHAIGLNLDSELLDKVDGIEIDEFDFDDELILDTEENNNSNRNNSHLQRSRFMSHIRLDNIDYEADQQVINHIGKVETELASKTDTLDKLQSDFDKMKADHDTAKAKVDELEKVDTAAEVKKAVTDRLALERQVTPHLDKEDAEKIDTLEDIDLKKKVILKAFPKADEQLKDASEDYITARFDSALEILASKEDGDTSAIHSQRQQANSQKKTDDKDLPDQEKSRNDMVGRERNAWKEEKEKKAA